MTLVSTEWLNSNLSKVKIFDASWHMPSTKRSGQNEYSNKHIPGALFWDLDEHSDKDSPFPHMLPNSDYWTRMLWSFGIKNDDHIVVYDFSDVHSACRLCFSAYSFFASRFVIGRCQLASNILTLLKLLLSHSVETKVILKIFF